MQGRLNTFQKSMLKWNDMHPYNAVHTVQVAGGLDLARMRTCLATVMEKHGFARLSLDRERYTFQYADRPGEVQIQTLAAPPVGDWVQAEKPSVDESGQVAFCALVAEMERQLNSPFERDPTFNPFRFLVLPAKDSFYLGLVYFHPIADAESAVWLLRDVVALYAGNSSDTNDRFQLYPEAGTHFLRRHPGVVVRKLLSLAGQIRNLRHSHRPHYADISDMTNGFACCSLAPEDLTSVVTTAKSWGVTVNDVFLSLLLVSLSACSATRAESKKRSKLSLGCIVNIRKDLNLERRRPFGLFLGSFIITHQVPDGVSLRHLAEDIRQQTLQIKRKKLYMATPLELGIARFAMRRVSPASQKKFYRKNYPLCGGITNMNLNLLWEQAGQHAMLDYFRGVSTGPATPLVLSATTVGQHLNMGWSYRTTVFSKTMIDEIVCRFQEQVRELPNLV